MTRITGKQLNKKWKVGARHALYHHEGTFYEHLRRFPGALFDRKGYILFNTKEAYERCTYFDGTHQEKLNVHPPGISGIPGYVKRV